jgi:hypothetical protein
MLKKRILFRIAKVSNILQIPHFRKGKTGQLQDRFEVDQFSDFKSDR